MIETIKEDTAIYVMVHKKEEPQVEVVRGIWYFDFENSIERLHEDIRTKAVVFAKKKSKEYLEAKKRLEEIKISYVKARGS